MSQVKYELFEITSGFYFCYLNLIMQFLFVFFFLNLIMLGIVPWLAE